MPRYYFHLYNDIVALDEEGTELADLEAARKMAWRSVVEQFCESVHHGHVDLGHRIEVADETGSIVMVMRFGDVVSISGQTVRPAAT